MLLLALLAIMPQTILADKLSTNHSKLAYKTYDDLGLNNHDGEPYNRRNESRSPIRTWKSAEWSTKSP